jgi:hypothetical protein
MVDYLLDMPWPFPCPICGPSAPFYGNVCRPCAVAGRTLPRHTLLFICSCLDTSFVYAAQMTQLWMKQRHTLHLGRPNRSSFETWIMYHRDLQRAEHLCSFWNNQYIVRLRAAARARWAFHIDAELNIDGARPRTACETGHRIAVRVLDRRRLQELPSR